jgi:putative transcriptional regulator
LRLHDGGMTSLLFRAGLLLALLMPAPGFAADLSQTVVLIAKRELQDRIYGASILIARPLDADRHVGLIINKPTQTTLSTLFPSHQPSRKVVDPVFLGGPVGSEIIFALVQRKDSPGNRSLRIGPDLYLATDSRVVDQIIEAEPSHARFFAGVVLWSPGELASEVRRGLWFVREPSSELVLQKPAGLWEKLVDRLELEAKTF